MTKNATASIAAIAVCLGVLVSAPANAQTSVAPTWQDAATQHHQRLYQLMKDMTQEMSRMTDQMSQGMSAPDRPQMAQRMRRMSMMMRRMAGLAARPAMTEPEWQRQMNRMRTQMDEMMRDPTRAPATN